LIKINHLKPIFIALVFTSSFPAVSAGQTQVILLVDIDDDFVDENGFPKDEQLFGKKSYYYVGDDDFITVSSPDFQNKFKQGEKDLFHFAGDQETTLWSKIQFKNKSNVNRSIYLFSDTIWIEELSVYQTGLIKTIGPKQHLQQRVIKLGLKPDSVTTFYIVQKEDGPKLQYFSFWKDREKLTRHIISIERNWGFIIAVFTMSLLITVMIYVVYRLKVHLYYCLFVISSALAITVLWGVVSLSSSIAIVYTYSFAAVSSALFIISFLNLKGFIRKLWASFIAYNVLTCLTHYWFLSEGYMVDTRVLTILGVIAGFFSFLFFGFLFYLIYIYIKKREPHVGIFCLAYGVINGGIFLFFMKLQGVLDYSLSVRAVGYAIALENVLMLLALLDKIYNKEKDRIKSNDDMHHSYAQLKKVFYPHQLTSMKNGVHLEKTMPVGMAEACVISFDIAGSSKIKGQGVKGFFRDIFSRCNHLMVRDYQENIDVKAVVANAFRIKEMGDGLICSVGFPYKSPTNNPFMDALYLAEDFIKIFNTRVKEFGYPEDIFCGCGIAYGDLETFYPDSNPIEYDAYGRGIVLACRYEAMRKVVLSALGLKGNVLTVSDAVYRGIDDSKKEYLTLFDLKAHNVSVRDDESAEFIYYRIIDG